MLGTGLHFAFEQNDSVLRLYFTDETGSGRTERKAKVKGVKNCQTLDRHLKRMRYLSMMAQLYFQLGFILTATKSSYM